MPITDETTQAAPAQAATGAGAQAAAGAQAQVAAGTGAQAAAGAQAASAPASPQASGEFRPKILAFCCNWCTYAGADLAGLNRMNYPADIRLLRVPCSGRVNPQYVLKALQSGCDGVLVCGCHPGDCHYTTGNYYARRRMLIYKRLVEFSGFEPDRFQVRWISGSEAGKFRDTVISVTQQIKDLGPIENDLPTAEVFARLDAIDELPTIGTEGGAA